MTTAVTPRDPSRFRAPLDDSEALIKEARARQRRRRLRFALILVGIAAAGGIGFGIDRAASNGQSAPACVGGGCAASAPAASTTATIPNPCTLLTNTEAAQPLGGVITARVLYSNRLARMCTWSGPIYHAYFQPDFHSILQVATFRETLSRFVRFSRGHVPVSGIGTKAYVDSGGAGAIRIWKKGYTIEIHSSAELTLPTLKKLALAAVDRL